VNPVSALTRLPSKSLNSELFSIFVTSPPTPNQKTSGNPRQRNTRVFTGFLSDKMKTISKESLKAC